VINDTVGPIWRSLVDRVLEIHDFQFRFYYPVNETFLLLPKYLTDAKARQVSELSPFLSFFSFKINLCLYRMPSQEPQCFQSSFLPLICNNSLSRIPRRRSTKDLIWFRPISCFRMGDRSCPPCNTLFTIDLISK
jgi:hypothetical protein